MAFYIFFAGFIFFNETRFHGKLGHGWTHLKTYHVSGDAKLGESLFDQPGCLVDAAFIWLGRLLFDQ